MSSFEDSGTMIFRISALELGLGSFFFFLADREGKGPKVLDDKKYIHFVFETLFTG